ncbi:MAG: hypothetical protein M0025_04745 [Elusimicrobia bacterium]|nr:hypothetical protein [Elusimicrobiota bacterium]
MPFLVITSGEELPQQQLLARALAAAGGLDLPTAAMTARRCWGILGGGMSGEAAAALEAVCAGLGIAVARLPAEALTPLPQPSPVNRLLLEGDRAAFSGPGGFSAAVSAAEISVLAAAPVKEEFFRTTKTTEGPSAQEKAIRFGIMAVTGLPIGLGKSKEVLKQVRSSETSFYMDILTGGSRLRLASDDFDFSVLGAKKTFSSQVNFRLLAAELAAFSPGAFRNTGLKALLAGRPLAALPYDSLADLEKETLRLSLAKGLAGA